MANLTVAEVMDRWPHNIPNFLRHQMTCIDCPLSLFETLAEEAGIYAIVRKRTAADDPQRKNKNETRR
jgi:hybrid cluster-associated redox disulfide protein